MLAEAEDEIWWVDDKLKADLRFGEWKKEE